MKAKPRQQEGFSVHFRTSTVTESRNNLCSQRRIKYFEKTIDLPDLSFSNKSSSAQS